MSSTLSFPELDEAAGKLNAARKELKDVFDEAGPDRDMTKVKSIPGTNSEKVEWIRTKNAEINTIAEQVESLQIILKGAENGAEYDEEGRSEKDGGRPQRTKSPFRQIAEAIALVPTKKQFRVELDGIDVKTTMTTTAGWAPDIIREPTVIPFATRPLELLDFIPTSPTTQASVSFMEETTFTNAAAERNEGAAKAESALALTERVSVVRSIATNIPVTDEQLEDVDGIDAYLNQRLPFFLRQRAEGQVLVGDGAAPNLRGLLNTAGIQTQAKGADPTPDAIYKAMVLVMTTGMATPDAVVMNPLDWQDVRLLRTADGIYIWGNPSEAGPQRIWGLPVLLAQAETQNTAIVGAFQMFCALRVKKGVTVERGFINDDFTKDITRLRAEMRAAFVVYRPAAFCTVTGV